MKKHDLNQKNLCFGHIMNIKLFDYDWIIKLQNQKTLPQNPTLSIFMVRLILCDCSLCQHGFDIQINQNILEKLIISRSAHQTPNFTNPKFQFPQFKVADVAIQPWF